MVVGALNTELSVEVSAVPEKLPKKPTAAGRKEGEDGEAGNGAAGCTPASASPRSPLRFLCLCLCLVLTNAFLCLPAVCLLVAGAQWHCELYTLQKKQQPHPIHKPVRG
jgi:hypothetical protein